MFGGRNRLSADEIRQMQSQLEYNETYFQKVVDARDIFDANISDIQNSREQMDKEILQVGDNIVTVISYTSSNVESEGELLQGLEDYQRRMKVAEQEFEELSGMIRQQAMDSQMLVEGNKYFTSPSKYMVEIPKTLRQQNEFYQEKLAQMTDFCKQMSVTTLNAAIEAGRMGEAGRSFVSATEQVRNLAVAYESAIQEMRQTILESEAKINRMEEKFQNVVSLLRDSNVAAGKLMKQCNETSKYIEKSSICVFSEEIAPFRDQIVGIKNLEEEIIKVEERNRMQMSDVREEMLTQQKTEQEIIELLDPIFDGK